MGCCRPHCAVRHAKKKKKVQPIGLDSIIDEQLHWVLLQHQVLSCQDNRAKVPVVGEPGVAVLLGPPPPGGREKDLVVGPGRP